MFSNYLKIALRNFAKHKTYSAINLGGLTIAIACCLLIGLFVRHEWSFDRFHTKSHRLYRAWTQEEFKGETFINTVTPYILGPTLRETFQEVEAVARLQTTQVNVRKGNEVLAERIHLVDPELLQMFDFPLLSSLGSNPLLDLSSVVLSEEVATKYFGNQNPIGQTLLMQIDSTMQPFTVRAIARNTPVNSSIRFGVLISMEHIKRLTSERTRKSWFNVTPETFVLLRESASAANLAAKFPALLRAQLGDKYKGTNYIINLQPLADIHLNVELAGGYEPVSNPVYSYILAAIAGFILLIACINFMTLSLGRSVSRAQEVGVRKAMGALRGQLMSQFWSETLLMTLGAVVLGIGLAFLLMPWFNQLSNQELEFHFDGTTFGFLLLLIGVVGLVAGSYPALVLSGFRPVEVLKGKISLKGDVNWFRRSLIVVQFGLSVLLMAGTFVLNRQLSFLETKSLGYRKELTVNLPVSQSGEEGRQMVERLRNAFSSRKEVLSVTASAFPFASGEWGNLGYTDDQKVYREFRFNTVDPYFIPAYGIKLMGGRNFDPTNSADRFGSFIVNEAFVRKFGLTNPVNGKLPGKLPDHRIIGVVADFHFASLHTKVEPLLLAIRIDSLTNAMENMTVASSTRPDLSVRLAAGSLPDRLKMLETVWKQSLPDEPFSYTFLDVALQRQYEADQRLGKVVTLASGLSILIACLGLFGLATLAVVRRTKEIGIRKVLGASLWSVVALLAQDFLKLIFIAILLAIPVAWWATSEWLSEFEYRIPMPWWAFVLAGVLALVVAFVTISFQSIKAALMNPVTALRTE